MSWIVGIALLLPFVASAHQIATFELSGSNYQIMIGSLNEPIAVDDRTGLDLTVTKCRTRGCMPSAGHNRYMDRAAGSPVLGLENSLKLEISAGTINKTLDLTPQYGRPGSYTATFYPTVATMLRYRLMGGIDKVPVDLSFICTVEGTPESTNDTTMVPFSRYVMRKSLSGGFGCPVDKENLGFPDRTTSILSIAVSERQNKQIASVALVLAVGSLVIAGFGLHKNRKI